LPDDLDSNRNKNSKSKGASESRIEDLWAQSNWSRLLAWHIADIPAQKLLSLMVITSALGVVDGLQAKYMNIGGLDY
jgi:hypothetical protein